ncbi:MAG: hypothetical protein ABII95_02565 [Patescibacteria group bacterium]|nr:hypothetical protein [Patescibacteria group bacterium]
MFYSIFSIFVYFSILFFFGWQLTRLLLKENRREFLIPLSLSFGIFFYIFILNITSYLIDVRINFYLVLIFLLIVGLGIKFLKKSNKKTVWSFEKKWRLTLLITFSLIIILSGFSAAREIDGDEVAFTQLPLSSTISQGNFPVKAPFLPDQTIKYHYASELWRASMYKISDIKLWFIHDIQIAIAYGLFFALSFIFVFYLTKKKLFSYLTALVALLGGGLNSFFGFKGIANLLSGNGNFAFIADMMHGQIHITASAAQSMILSWATVAFPVVILILYLYVNFWDNKKEWIKFSILISILLTILALSAETFFVIMLFSFLIFSIFNKEWKSFLLINILTWPIVMLQGGLFTEMFKKQREIVSYDFFISISPFFIDFGQKVSIFSYHFILNWGLLILIIPALIYIYKKKNKYLLLIGLISLVAYVIPFVIHIKEWSWEIRRVLFLVPPLWGILVSLFLLNIYQAICDKMNRKLVLTIFVILFVFICFDSLIFLTAHAVKPYYRPDGNESFWGQPVEPSYLESEIYLWVKENTTLEDIFFTFDNKISYFPNRNFVLQTGRFAPTFQIFREQNLNIPETMIFQKIKKDCDNQSFKILNYHYLYVNQYWPEDLEKKCLSNNDLELKFDNSSDGYVSKIYLIKN